MAIEQDLCLGIAWAIAASISARVHSLVNVGVWAIDFRVTCGTRSYTKPFRMSPAVDSIGIWPVRSASLRCPSGVSAIR